MLSGSPSLLSYPGHPVRIAAQGQKPRSSVVDSWDLYVLQVHMEICPSLGNWEIGEGVKMPSAENPASASSQQVLSKKGGLL